MVRLIREGQIGHDTIRVLIVYDDLVRLREDIFDRLDDQPLPGHVLGPGIFLVDTQESLRFALCFGNYPRLVTFGVFDNLGRFTARGTKSLIAILLRFADQPILILLGALHLFKRVDDLRWRIGPFELHAGDAYAGGVTVEGVLYEKLNLLLRRLPAAGADFVSRRAAGHFTHGTFRDNTDELFGRADVEEIILRIPHFPQHGKLDVDDVLVARECEALLRRVAELQQVLRLDRHGFNRFDRPKDEVKARTGRAGVFAEIQDDALLLRPDDVDRIVEPDCGNQENRQQPGHAASASTRKRRFELVLHTLNKIFEIRRGSGIAAAGTIGALAPRPLAPTAGPTSTPLILPWHSLLPREPKWAPALI
jgi:hypothetical protein